MRFPFTVPDDFPETLLANKTLFPSRLSCENGFGALKPERLGTKRTNIRLLRLATLILENFFHLLSLILRFNTRSRHKAFEKSVDFLLLSHYVGPQQKYDLDPFLGDLARKIRTRFPTFTFFFNSTKAPIPKVELEIQRTLRHEFAVNRGKVQMRSLILVICELFTELNLVMKNMVSNRSLSSGMSPSQIFLSQLSRSTISILFAWENLSKTILRERPRFVIIPCEGNSHELLFVHRLKKHFPEIRILMYQHAPVVLDQPGFYRVVSNLRKQDILLLSSNNAMSFVQEVIPSKELTCVIVKIGSSRKKQIHKIESQTRQARVDTSRRVLVAPEGTNCALQEILNAANHYRQRGVNAEIRIRLHPDSVRDRKVFKLLASKDLPGIISESTLEEDLMWADEIWFRCSSVVDVAIQMNVLPVHVNLNPYYNLNPLHGLSQPFIEIRSLDDINHLEQNRDKLGNFSFSSNETDFIFQAFCMEVFTSLLHSLYRS